MEASGIIGVLLSIVSISRRGPPTSSFARFFRFFAPSIRNAVDGFRFVLSKSPAGGLGGFGFCHNGVSRRWRAEPSSKVVLGRTEGVGPTPVTTGLCPSALCAGDEDGTDKSSDPGDTCSRFRASGIANSFRVPIARSCILSSFSIARNASSPSPTSSSSSSKKFPPWFCCLDARRGSSLAAAKNSSTSSLTSTSLLSTTIVDGSVFFFVLTLVFTEGACAKNPRIFPLGVSLYSTIVCGNVSALGVEDTDVPTTLRIKVLGVSFGWLIP
mmetsp:Transcript_8889/g.14441  ORF Transcript_8889/g.14441 Transcript_8889/m.14441 type:complete len:270 (-) Transcript_8889:289-1098(-)